MANFLKRLIFNRGGIGKSLSRAETVERINPILEQHVRLNRSYDAVIRDCSDVQIADQLDELQKKARMDAGKLAETIFSAGGTAYNGTDLEPEDFDLGANDDERLAELRALEQDLHETVTEERDRNHQLRTDAILQVVEENSADRLEYLRGVTKGRRRTAAS